METVTFYGAGMLGSGFVRSLLRSGHNVRVWNRTPDKARALEAFGARAFEGAAEAARGANRVHLCVRDDDAVDSILDAALTGIGRNAPIVDHTTVLPQRVVAREQRLAAAGYAFLHAPVFMGPPQTLDATGLMLACGARDRFDRIAPSLEAMTGSVKYLGERVDLAAVYKLLGNAMILTVIGGVNDVFRIAEECGLSRTEAYEIFSFYNVTGQITGRAKRMSQDEYEPTWTLDMARKDATLMQAAANHAPLPVIDAIEVLMDACMKHGLGSLDLGAIAKR